MTTRGFLREDIKDLLNNEKYSDIQFVFKERNIKYFAHKFILGLISDVFDTMCFGALAKSSMTKCVIEIVDISAEIFYLIMRFIYTEHLTLTKGNLSEVYYAANKYNIGTLQLACESFFMETCNVNTVCVYLEELIHYDKFKEMCLEFIDGNCDELLKKEKFTTLNEDVITTIIKRDSLQVNEFELFKFLLKLYEQGDGAKRASRLKEKHSIFNNVRFPIMTSDEFGNCVKLKPNFFTSEDVGNIFKFICVGIKDENLKYSTVKRKPNIQKVFLFDTEVLSSTYQYIYEFKFCVKKAVTVQEFHVLTFETFNTSVELLLKNELGYDLLFSGSVAHTNLITCEPTITLLPNEQYKLKSTVQCILSSVNKCASSRELLDSKIFDFPKNLKTFVYKIGFVEEIFPNLKRQKLM